MQKITFQIIPLIECAKQSEIIYILFNAHSSILSKLSKYSWVSLLHCSLVPLLGTTIFGNRSHNFTILTSTLSSFDSFFEASFKIVVFNKLSVSNVLSLRVSSMHSRAHAQVARSSSTKARAAMMAHLMILRDVVVRFNSKLQEFFNVNPASYSNNRLLSNF